MWAFACLKKYFKNFLDSTDSMALASHVGADHPGSWHNSFREYAYKREKIYFSYF